MGCVKLNSLLTSPLQNQLFELDNFCFGPTTSFFVFVIVSITITITITITKTKNPMSAYKRKISSSKSWNSKWQVKNDITRTQPPPEIHWTLGYPLSLSVDANVRTAWTLGSIEELLSKCSPYNTVLHWCVALISKDLFLFFQIFSMYEGPHQYRPKWHVGRAIPEVGYTVELFWNG